jgi:hypothetical protein
MNIRAYAESIFSLVIDEGIRAFHGFDMNGGDSDGGFFLNMSHSSQERVCCNNESEGE